MATALVKGGRPPRSGDQGRCERQRIVAVAYKEGEDVQMAHPMLWRSRWTPAAVVSFCGCRSAARRSAVQLLVPYLRRDIAEK